MGSANRLHTQLRYNVIMSFYMIAFCIAPGFSSVFLVGRGYSNTQTGIILAISMVLTIVLQPTIASVIDRSKTHTPIFFITLIALVGAACTVLMTVLSAGSLLLAVVFLMFAAIIRVLQPLVNAFAFYLERRGGKVNYGIARGIGSLAYACMAAPLGKLCVQYGVGILPIIGLIALLMLIFAICSCGSGSTAMESRTVTKTHHSFPEIARRNPSFVFLLAGTLLLFFNYAAAYNFMMPLVADVGGDSADVGALGSFGAVLELPAMLGFARLRKRFSCTRMLKVAAVFFSVKGLLVLLAGSIPMLFVAMSAQALSFAIFTPASVRYVDEVMSPADANRGQAYVTAMISGGYILSSSLGGVLIDSVGMRSFLLLSLIAGSVGTILILVGMKPQQKTAELPH